MSRQQVEISFEVWADSFEGLVERVRVELGNLSDTPPLLCDSTLNVTSDITEFGVGTVMWKGTFRGIAEGIWW